MAARMSLGRRHPWCHFKANFPPSYCATFSSLPISGPRSAFTASLSTKAQYENSGEPYELFAVLRQSAFANAGYTVQNPCAASRNAAALPYPTYLDII
jgi:hypothetical protein